MSRADEGRPERLPEVAAELVRLNFDVLVTSTNEVTAAAKRATTTVPIVMALGGNPVGAGFIASLARPGGNITGVTFDAEPEAYAKPLQFLKETLPHLSRVAVLRSPGPAWQPMWDAARDAASKLAIELQPLDFRTPADIEPVFVTMKKERLRAFLFWADPVTYPSRKQVADLSIKNGLASASLVRQFADAGGLMAYGPSILDLFRHAAAYVDKVLKGAKPADLPVEQPTKFELVVNLKTAKALGLTIPRSVLIRADQVIQ